MIGTIGIAAYFAYNKYQITKLQAALLKILEETHNIILKTINEVQGTQTLTPSDEKIIETYKETLLLQKEKIQALLSQYSTRIKQAALFAQDKNGNTILHNDTINLSAKCSEKREENKQNRQNLSWEGENVATLTYFEQIISTLINQCNDTATKDRLLATINHNKKPLFITLSDYYVPRGRNFPKFLHRLCGTSEDKYCKIYTDFNLRRNFPNIDWGK